MWKIIPNQIFSEISRAKIIFHFNFNPIWAGLFANLKRLGGHFGPPPNLAISSQMTMKLSKGILWVEIFTN